jgi:hypothetical protein
MAKGGQNQILRDVTEFFRYQEGYFYFPYSSKRKDKIFDN